MSLQLVPGQVERQWGELEGLFKKLVLFRHTGSSGTQAAMKSATVCSLGRFSGSLHFENPS